MASDTPRVSITTPSHVVEGSPFTFTLSVDPEPTTGQSYTVPFTVANASGSPSYLGTVTPSSLSVTLDETNKTASVTVNTLEPSGATTDGTINLQVTDGANYDPRVTVPTPVTVQNKDLMPKVSIAASRATIEEGEAAVFELTAASPNPTANFDAMVQVTRDQLRVRS